MSTEQTDTAPESTEATETTEAVVTEQVEGEESLGDPGKKALDAMKAERKSALDRAKTAEDELGRLKAAADGKEADYEANRKATEEVNTRFNERLVSAELRAAAKGVLEYPEDIILHLKTTDFDVDGDGNVDAEAITAAVDELIARKPRLAAQGGTNGPRPDVSQGATTSTSGTTGQQFAAAFKQAL